MTASQIEAFLTVARERSFTRAANTMYISQPAVSIAISKLEAELGTRLFERFDGELSLTEAGKQFFDFFQRAREEYRQLCESIGSAADRPAGVVRVGCPETWNPCVFYSRLVALTAEKYPAVELIIESYKLSELINRIRAGKLDLVITHDFYPVAQYGLETRRLVSTRCGVLYAKEFFRGIRALEDFRDTDFLLFDNEIERKFSETIRAICSEHGFAPRIKNYNQFSTALFNLSCGKGVMLFTDWDNAITNTSYGYLPLDYSIPVNIICQTENQKHMEQYARDIVELFSAGR